MFKSFFNAPPIGTVEDACWTDMEEDHGVSWSEVI